MSANRRRGFTLIDQMMALTLLSVLMVLVAGLIAVLLRIDRPGKAWLEDSSRWSRLSDRFRADVHGCVKAETTAEGLSLRRPDGGTIVYATAANRVERRTYSGDLSVPGRMTDRIEAPAGGTFALALEADGKAARLRFLRSTGPRTSAATREVSALATIGRGRRHEAP